MIKKGDKKGSHVEIIISFIIFVTFVFFIFSIIEPSINSQKDKESILNDVEVSIMDRISSDMTIITIKITSSTSQNCIKLDEEITASGINSRIVSKGILGQSFNSDIFSSDPDDLIITRTSTDDNFLKIYSSDAFSQLTQSSSSCQNLVRGTDYALGLTKTDKYFFESKVIDLIGQYSDYETLKSNLKIPKEIEFGYGLKLSNGTIIETNGEELSTNIYLREIPIKYVDSNGNILMGFLKIKIW